MDFQETFWKGCSLSWCTSHTDWPKWGMAVGVASHKNACNGCNGFTHHHETSLVTLIGPSGLWRWVWSTIGEYPATCWSWQISTVAVAEVHALLSSLQITSVTNKATGVNEWKPWRMDSRWMTLGSLRCTWQLHLLLAPKQQQDVLWLFENISLPINPLQGDKAVTSRLEQI